MPRETRREKEARAQKIFVLLQQAYPTAHCELHYSSPLELLIATILSAQCTDKMVNVVTTELFRKYGNASDFAQADPSQLEQDLRRLGFFRMKARNIRACCQKLIERHGGQVPRSMEELTQLVGVGRKTANVVLGNAFNQNVGIVVDTHVTRLSRRMGFTKETEPVKIEDELIKIVPRDSWTSFSHWMIWHGRRRCGARNPDCAGCEIRLLCPSAGKCGPPRAQSKQSRQIGRPVDSSNV